MSEQNSTPAQCDAAQAAREHVAGLIADLQGEHEVMAGPFDPAAWKLEVPVVHLQALLGVHSPAASDDLVASLVKDNERLRAQVIQLGNERDHAVSQVEKLKGYAHHKSGCAYHYGHDCDCGVEELRK